LQLCELAFPIAFVAILVAIKNSVKNSEGFQSEIIEATYPSAAYKPLTFRDYVTALQAEHKCVEGINDLTGQFDFWITGVPNQGYNWQIPFVKCDSRRCERDGEDAQQYCQFGIIGVSGSDANDVGGQLRVDDFTAWLYVEYPELMSNMPFDFDIVKKFNEPQAMDDYVKSSDYGKTGNPKIVMGIVFDGNREFDYKYSLRQNSTNFNSPESEWQPATRTTPDTNRLFKNYAKDDYDVCYALDGAAEQGWLQESCTGQYLYNGILTFQRLLGDFILSDSGAEENGYFVAESGVTYSSFPTFQYEESGFSATLVVSCRLGIVLSFALRLRDRRLTRCIRCSFVYRNGGSPGSAWCALSGCRNDFLYLLRERARSERTLKDDECNGIRYWLVVVRNFLSVPHSYRDDCVGCLYGAV
jgi:hypothetical protein